MTYHSKTQKSKAWTKAFYDYCADNIIIQFKNINKQDLHLMLRDTGQFQTEKINYYQELLLVASSK